MFEPPILPKGPGWTDGDINNDLMPFFPLKLINVTIVSIDHPFLQKWIPRDWTLRSYA